MRRLLVDTSYLVAHFNVRDVHHQAALRIQDRFMAGEWEELVLLDGVFAETITVLANRHSYAHAKKVGERLRSGAEISWVATGAHLDEIWYQYLAQPDGDLSLVDCALVAVAQIFKIDQIATFDEGFDAVAAVERVP